MIKLAEPAAFLGGSGRGRRSSDTCCENHPCVEITALDRWRVCFAKRERHVPQAKTPQISLRYAESICVFFCTHISVGSSPIWSRWISALKSNGPRAYVRAFDHPRLNTRLDHSVKIRRNPNAGSRTAYVEGLLGALEALVLDQVEMKVLVAHAALDACGGFRSSDWPYLSNQAELSTKRGCRARERARTRALSLSLFSTRLEVRETRAGPRLCGRCGTTRRCRHRKRWSRPLDRPW